MKVILESDVANVWKHYLGFAIFMNIMNGYTLCTYLVKKVSTVTCNYVLAIQGNF